MEDSNFAFDDILSFGNHLFITLVLVLSAGISSSICHGTGTQKGRETFIVLILLLMAGVQMFHLINAVVYVPATRFYTYNTLLHREDCIDSTKGGKRPGKNRISTYFNPCFCAYGNNCTAVATGLPLNETTCYRDHSSICRNKYGQKVDKYASKLRDCNGGQGKFCTKDQPCTPCELDKLVEFGAGRCGSCSTDFTGFCDFIPEVGPFCLESNVSKNVIPCKTCCTPPEPLMVDGLCY